MAGNPKDGLLAFLLIEVADFPGLRARLGFQAGADLLDLLANHFSRAIGARGTVLRLDEGGFCIFVGGLRNRGHAVLAAEKLSRAVDEAMAVATLTIRPELHIGIALYPAHAQEPAELVRRAQFATAAARKRSARMVVFDEDCGDQVLKSWALSEDFVASLESGEMAMYYQPKVRMSDRRTYGAEALMRWMRDGKTIATPDVFIPLAEQAGLIHNATWFALTTSLREITEWPVQGMGVAVNVTPGMLHHRDFVEMVRSAVTTWGVKKGCLTLEITEGALIADFGQATAKLSRLRDMGVRISIDDFGTGYSSLSYFKKIPAEELKIDKSFVMGMLKDESDQRLVETIVRLAQQFKLEVVAEGVEDAATFEALAKMGCHYAQGYHFAPALPQAKFCAWLEGK